MNLCQWIQLDLEEVANLLEGVTPVEGVHLGEIILHTRRVFVVGQGRTGLVMKMFAMRLMQLGIETYVVGETTTPSLFCEDLLIAASGSGRTASVITIARHAKELGARVSVITTVEDSPLGQLADHLTTIPGESIKVIDAIKSRLPMANALEQSLLVFLDCVIACVAEQKNETNESMMRRHANLE